jgi:hypothetical protein
MTMRSSILTIGITFLFCSCASLQDDGTPEPSKSILSAEEIATTTAFSAYEAIALKRPQFLKSRAVRKMGGPSAAEREELPVVYLDGIYCGDIESLRSIQVSQIESIQRIDHNEAVLRFGRDRTGGVLMIITKTAQE